MKKSLLVLSITLMTLWIVGFFILNLPSLIHVLLASSMLLYIRSLMTVSDSATQKYYKDR
jgi:hypothetical protein